MAKNEKELETLIQTVRIYNQDMGMEFSIEKRAILKIKSGKRYRTEGTELPKTKLEGSEKQETYKYYEILGVDTIKYAEMEKKKEYLRRTRKLLETKLHS